jgi:hypothetical protein
MWKVLLVIFAIALGFLILSKQYKKEQKKPRDRTGELVEKSDLEDLYGRDLLDIQCARITGSKLRPPPSPKDSS